jgi:flagellar biogenesis protein FliO
VTSLTRRLSYVIACSLICWPTVSLGDQSSTLEPPTITRSTFAPVPLRAPNKPDEKSDQLPSTTARSSTTPLITVGSSLAIVLGLFAALVWVSRKSSKNVSSNREIPDDAMRILGKKSLGPSGSIALVRCGRSVLIVGIHSTGMQRLGEITSDDEIRHLEALCNGKSKASFDETLAEIQREPIKRGFIGEEIHHPKSNPRNKLFSAS